MIGRFYTNNVQYFKAKSSSNQLRIWLISMLNLMNVTYMGDGNNFIAFNFCPSPNTMLSSKCDPLLLFPFLL